MTDRERLEALLRAETILKQTTAGYGPTRPRWKVAMPLLWKVRLSLRGTADGYALAEAHGILKQTVHGYDPRASRWREAMKLIDAVERNLAVPPVPNLGPIEPGGKPLLLYAPTHKTSGLHERTGSYYPAVDFGWDIGEPVFAPEPLVVSAQSSSRGGDAFYADGESGIDYWWGHLRSAPSTGTRFRRGDIVGWIADITEGADHSHLGINAKPLIGKDLRWGRNGNGPDYTYGSPTVGKQLAAALAV